MRKFPASFEQNVEFWWTFRKIQGFLGTSSTQSVTKVENKHKSCRKQTHGYISVESWAAAGAQSKVSSSSATIIVEFSLKLISSRAKPKKNTDGERKCQAEYRKFWGNIVRQNIDVGRANLGHDYNMANIMWPILVLSGVDWSWYQHGCTVYSPFPKMPLFFAT